MAWPPPVLPINRSNADPQMDQHPADHNAANLAINDLVAKTKEKYVTHVHGNAASLTIPPNGVLGFIGGTAVPAVPWSRLLVVFVRGLCTVCQTNSYSDLNLLVAGTQNALIRARASGPGNPMGVYTKRLPANTAITYAVNASAGPQGNVQWTADGTFSGLDIVGYPDSA